MLQFWNTKLEKLIIHKVGNKSSEDGVIFSDSTIDLSDELNSVFLKFFLNPFTDLPSYAFTHSVDLQMNEVYQLVTEIFRSHRTLIKHSRGLATLLYETSLHPKIKPGELYIAYFKDCHLGDTKTDAIGIFKSENRETFLNIQHHKSGFEIHAYDGVSTSKLDKGCLIINLNADQGYTVYNIDNINKSNEAVYWKDEFLKLKPASDNYHHTKNFLTVTKDFLTKKISEEFEISKTDQIDLLNKSVEYFKDNEVFSMKDFEKTVLNDKEYIRSFRKFGSDYVTENEIDIADTFEISAPAVKKQSRIFRNVVKLDKNFHIYIHGNTELIEKGYDSKVGKHFYKIYFEQES